MKSLMLEDKSKELICTPSKSPDRTKGYDVEAVTRARPVRSERSSNMELMMTLLLAPAARSIAHFRLVIHAPRLHDRECASVVRCIFIVLNCRLSKDVITDDGVRTAKSTLITFFY